MRSFLRWTIPIPDLSRDGPPMRVAAPQLAATEAARRWAALLQQIFVVDPLACPSCHGAMRIVACITQTSVTNQILTHFRTPAAREAHGAARSPPSPRAPASRSPSRATRTTRQAPARDGGHAAARQAALARSACAPYVPRIVGPPRLIFR